MSRSALLALSFALHTAVAAEQTHRFDIEPQPLSSALEVLARQGCVKTFFPDSAVAGKRSKGLKGDYTAREAINRLLAGTGLNPSFIADNAVTIKADSGNDSTALPKVIVKGKAGYESNDPYNPNYMRPAATTATKTDTPIMETPVSVQVVPKAVMDDQQATRLEDILKNVSGIQFSAPGVDVFQDSFIIRGFDSEAFVYRNGLRATAFKFEPANLNQVEVLKGPAAVLYGRAQPGGLINVVTKQPLTESYYSAQQQFGSYDLYRTTIDATGPLNDDRSLLYRVNLSNKSSNSFQEFTNFERVMFAPQVSWLVSDRTRIDLSLEYQHEDYGAPYAFPTVGTRPAALPWRRNLSEPFSHHENDKTILEFAWSHQFNDAWTLRNRFQGQFQGYQQLEVYPTGLQADGRTMGRALYDVYQDRTTYATNFELLGKFDTWSVGHEVLLGFDYYNFDWKGDGHCCTDSETVRSIDIYNPVHGGIDWRSITSGPNDFFYRVAEEWKGFYFQDQISFFDNQVHLLAGGRHDWLSTGSGFSPTSFNEAQASLNADEVDTGRFTPRVGITYQPKPWLSLYANYTEGFGSNNSGRSATGKPFAPETSKQYEAGIKAEAFDGRLRATVAAYEITKNNVLTVDNSTLDPNDFALIGKARSKGIEFDVSGELDEHWSVIAGYAYNDARVAGADTLKGNRLPRAPENSGNAWLKYQFTDGLLQGLSLGTGAYLASQREGDLENSFRLPGYVRWDMAAAYLWKVGDYRLTTRININNVLDKHYYASAISRRSSAPADPLTVMGSLQVEF